MTALRQISGIKLFFVGVWNRIIAQRWLKLGLRGKMGLLVEIGLIGLISIFLILGVSTARTTTLRILSERMVLARQSAATIDATLRHVYGALEITAERLKWIRADDRGAAEKYAAIETAYNQIAPMAQGVYWLDLQGRIVFAASNGDLTLDWRELTKLRDGSGLTVFELPSGDTRAVLIEPLEAADRTHNGWLAAILDFNQVNLATFQNPLELGETGELDLVNAEGRVLLSSKPKLNRLEDIHTDISALFIAGKPGVETCLGCSGSDNPESSGEVIAFAPLTQAPWGVIIRQQFSELMAPVNRLLIQTLILGLGTVLGALGLVWVTTSSVIKPVQKLTQAVNRIAEGDLETPMEELVSEWFNIRRSRQDEISDLAANLETMRRQLQRSMDEVVTLNRDLDRRVHERTEIARAAQEQAQAARDDLRAIIDALDDELMVVDVADYHIRLANKAAQERNGCREDLIGQACYCSCHIDHPCPPEAGGCPIGEVLKTGDSVRITQELADDDGDKIYREIVASPMRNSEGQIDRVVELMRDVSEEKRMKASLIRRNQQLSILNAVAAAVNQSLKLKDILDLSLDAVLRLTEIDMGAVFLFEELQGALKLMAYRGFSSEAALLANNLGLLDTSCGGVVEHGRVVVVPDISHYRGIRARSLQREGVNMLVHVPLTAKGCVLGSMCFGTRHERDFNPEEQDLLRAIGSQIAVAIENARLYAEVQQKERMRGELLKKVITAQEEERKRIARELHDETSQSLTALLYAAEEAMEMKSIDTIHKRIVGMHDVVQHTLDGVHKLIFDLRPSVLDNLGLVPAIRWLAKSRLEPKGVRFTIDDDSSCLRFSPELETALFRVIQEAMTNIARHSAARNVWVQCCCRSEDVHILVRDDGVGFDPGELELSPNSLRGLGLLGMQERLDVLGGELQISSVPGSGTTLEIRVPLGNGRIHRG